MNWSTGIYGIGSFSKRNTYSSTFNPNMDTITVSALEDDALKMCIGSQMVFDFTGSKSIAPSINLGAAVDLWDDKDIHFLLGQKSCKHQATLNVDSNWTSLAVSASPPARRTAASAVVLEGPLPFDL